MQWETVIGLEVHAQLSTQSKIFSGASTAYGAEPNVQACAVDIALPGVLPVLNKAAVEQAIKFGLAVDAKINLRSVFARKNYFYPDLPKGYQISQYELPIVQGGELQIVVGDAEKTVRLTRAHLEEDAGKSLHENFRDSTGIDLNRAGTPLLEIVSEPDMRSSAEAVAYAKKLHTLVQWNKICDGNMQEGSFRFDANVSVRRKGSDKLGTRCEIKNLNSFRFLEHAIEFEAKRQIEILEDGGVIMQETRLYDPEKDETRSMRIKEEAHDYRYFPDPDLLPLEISEQWINEIRAALPESQQAKRKEFMSLGLSAYQATLLTTSREMAEYATNTVSGVPTEVIPSLANIIVGPLSARLNKENLPLTEIPISPDQLKQLGERIHDGTVSASAAVTVLAIMWPGGGDADTIIKKHGLKQISDAGAIEKIVDEVLAANSKQVEDYHAGKEKAFNSLVGQVMKATKGKANPQQLNERLKRKLAG